MTWLPSCAVRPHTRATRVAEPAVPLWQSLLAERERRSLRVAFFMRAAIGASGVVTVWYTASSLAERLASSALLLTLLLACLLMLRALRTARAVALAAAVGAILDCVVLVGLVWIWHLAYTAPTTPLMHLLGHNLTVVTLLLVMINGAALRPVYPAAVAGFGALLHIALAVMALGDPRIGSLPGGLGQALGLGRGVGDLYLVPGLIVIGGGILAALTHAARRSLREVVEREEREQCLREDQIRVVLEARMSALAQIVSGVEPARPRHDRPDPPSVLGQRH